MATSGRGSGVVGYNVQVAVDIKNHLIVTHEVTNVTEMALHVLAYNLTRVMNIVGVKPLLVAIRA